MKKIYFLMAAVCLHLLATAQTDTLTVIVHNDSIPAKQNKRSTSDTIRIGNLTITRELGHDSAKGKHAKTADWRGGKPKNINTSWFTFDLGLTNYTDNTDYASTQAQEFAPGATKDWFKLRSGKSVDVNIWFVTQRLNLVKHVINLKYALGIELNNYHYKEEIRFQKSPTLVYKDDIIYRKNKLAADYLTVPVMLNFNFTPKKEDFKSFGLSIGASAGYLYSARQKFISDETGKQKVKDDFDLRTFKISYVAELKLAGMKFYGSLASRSMFEKGLDQTPYTVGVRFGRY